MELSESKIRTRLNTLVKEKLDGRKKQLMEGPVACDCVSTNGMDCGCGPTVKHDGVVEDTGDTLERDTNKHEKMFDYHTAKALTVVFCMKDWHLGMAEIHSKAMKEAFATDDGREVYKDSEDGAYDELHGKREGGPQANSMLIQRK